MRDYQRYLAGTLQDAYLARTPSRAELAAGAFSGDYSFDDWLTNHLRIVHGRALQPDLLGDVLDPETDKAVPDDEHAVGAERGRAALAAEPYIPPRKR
jgi:hypothetical protein